jgi:hypothetical protein
VEDVEEDGQLVKLRWLYRPEELPANALKVIPHCSPLFLYSNLGLELLPKFPADF